jgi:NAD(P)-dependent dehydrogenase (short-subunit alcohol dehydrogenase family)
MIDAVIRALEMALAMGWEILWPLILGFALSAVVQAAVSHQQMSRLLPDDRPRSIATALALGAASSSCSYAAVALARSIFRKGAHFTVAMAFEMASTNLVLRRQSQLDEAIASIDGNAAAIQGDTTNLGDLDRIFAKIRAQAERIDVLAANAGVYKFGTLGEITEEHFDKTFNTNVRGLLFTV